MSNTSASAISETTRASRKVFRPGRIGGAASTGAQCIREAADRNLCGRSHSEYGAAQERDGGGETKNSEIDGHVRQFANHFGPDRFEDMDSPNCQQQTSGAAQRTQQQAFGEHLPHEAGTAGAHGGADGDFLPPNRGTR